MTGNFIDTYRFRFKKVSDNKKASFSIIETDFGKVRVLDTKGDKPVLINSPDGPNVIEHHENLIEKLSEKFRVICFEFPGLGFSYPNSKFDYSLKSGASLIINLMDVLKIKKATLFFSCSNGFYAIKAAQMFPNRVNHILLSQTPSMQAMRKWTEIIIPKVLTYPFVGQLINSFSEKKLAKIWYKGALPKTTDRTDYVEKAMNSLSEGGCFCLSSLVQGLKNESEKKLEVTDVSSTLVWGAKDYSHRNTNGKSITEHLPNCEIFEFSECGHFSEIEDTDRFIQIVNQTIK